jgi:hypothetical protein
MSQSLSCIWGFLALNAIRRLLPPAGLYPKAALQKISSPLSQETAWAFAPGFKSNSLDIRLHLAFLKAKKIQSILA